jgi:glyoxylase-like metal-dependent hydrolase (beta-lactamase superfamily II)
MRRLLLVAVIVTLGIAAAAQSGRAPAGIGHEGNAFRFNKVRDGVYHAVGTGALAVVGNSAFIVNDDDVVAVDDHVSPAAAWVLLDEIRAVTNKPVTTVINTHFHFDHAHGNQIFDSRVNIIGHEFTRQMLLSNSTAMPLLSKLRDRDPAPNRRLEEARRRGDRRREAGGAQNSDRRRGKQQSRAGGTQADAAERHVDRSDDPLPRRP